MEFYITDDSGNKIVGLGQLLESLRPSGLNLGRWYSNDQATVTQLLLDKLSFDIEERQGCSNLAALQHLSEQIAEHSLEMPQEIIDAKGYTLQQKVSDYIKQDNAKK